MKYVFYFTADWCEPCKKVRPIVEELKKEGDSFQIIDIDYNELLVKQHEIKSVPTFILFENNIEINRTSGTKTKKELGEFIKNEKVIQAHVQS